MSTDFRAAEGEQWLPVPGYGCNAITNLYYGTLSKNDSLMAAHGTLAQPELRGGRGSITLLQVGASCGGGAHLTRDQCHYILNLLAIPLVNP